VKLLVTAISLILLPTACAAQVNAQQPIPELSVRGKVLQEPDGLPIRKASVQLNGRPGQAAPQYSAVTDAEGRFTIADVQAGTYVVVVEHPGFVQINIGNRRTSITVQPGSDKSDLILRMQPAAIITGKIVDLDGDPMRDVSVMATRAGSIAGARNAHNFGYAGTNDLGEFRISELRAGRYKVTASPPQGMRAPDSKDSRGKDQPIYLPTHYPGVLNEDQVVAVEVHPGVESRINFGLRTGQAYHVSGAVIGLSSKNNLAEIMLQSTRTGGSEISPQQLGEGGKFEFASVLPGTYVARLIVATFDGGQPAMQMLRLGQPIEVSNSHVEGLRLQPETGGEVRGKFRIDAQQKFDWTQLGVMLIPEEDGVALGWSEGNGLPTSANLNPDGSFELKNVPGGNYQLLVSAHANNLPDYFTKAITLDGRDVADSGFPITSETYLDVVISAKGASITGTVVDAQGQPVANATVLDVPSSERRSRLDLYQRDTTDASGHFSLRGLNPGKYSVFAFEELQEDFRRPEFLRSYGTRGEVLELDEGSRKNIVLKLIPDDSEAQ
jgi:protocatechuate 3,4-dioxygenase beta subunit